MALLNCKGCRRLFAPQEAQEYCDACLFEGDVSTQRIAEALERLADPSVENISEATGLTVADVKRALAFSKSLSHRVREGDVCAHCGERQPQAGSTFCLPCRLELHATFGKALEELSRRPPEKESPRFNMRMGAMEALSALEEKRRRTGTHRFDPSPTQRKGYR